MTDAEHPFLRARWVDLALVTWRIPADLLHAWLPPGLEPDRLPGDAPDAAYVSFVAFRFLDTAVKGVSVPLHTDFPEVNLRAYVREPGDGGRRGVTFIAELVPKPAIAVIANLLYHEHYRAVPMSMDVRDADDGDTRTIDVRIELGERVHAMRLVGRHPPVLPEADSVEHFFKEHEWGFGRDGDGGVVVYRVEHPVWACYTTSPDDLELGIDFGELYGQPWSELDRRQPFHVAFAVGSEISVWPRER
ncbi:MAG TPA: DUF2071 domain-containing protein [Nannocystaceae bacterium]|nr:DUF2071 domain-containing protein [Nannocystaceae bacterium]